MCQCRRGPRRARPRRRAARLQPAGHLHLTDLTATYLVFYGGAFLLLLAGGLLTNAGPWYKALRKPPLQPPAWLFAPAWTTILALAAQSGVMAWTGARAWEQPLIAVVFGINAILHVLWTPLFFKARRPDWAMIEIPLLLASVVALMVVVVRTAPAAPWLLVPYLLWVAFAVYLNAGIIRLNPRFGA